MREDFFPVLAISGSPRSGGNTELLMDACLTSIEEAGLLTEKIRLTQLNFSPCQECGGCAKTGQCVIQDDMQGLYASFRQASGIILGSPIFFGSLSAQTKMMIDRSQCCWVAKYILDQPLLSAEAKIPAIFLSVGGMNRYRFFQNALQIAKIWFTILNLQYISELFYPDIDQKGAIKQHPSALTKAHLLGKYLTQVILNRK